MKARLKMYLDPRHVGFLEFKPLILATASDITNR